ncbi:hypothetical protein J7394_07500 [Ruegeria sp. R13_0]|uniref:hypothetical protein n=1 Tax=Ruegeria sp. R13_0 TaxID=2821099 RepID=UPI001ADD0473|nr:hypothetical protein [Ruegeria sp. R13_0]MBO9434044.1 hypothetical protein [Ruegeria sp. R13_0]
MSEILTIELSEAEFAELRELAHQAGVSVEEQAAHIIEAQFESRKRVQKPEVSTEFLRQNVDAVLDAVNRGPVYIRAENELAYVIMLTEEYDRLSAPY